jgi:2'-5' RNA ligase
VDVDVTASGLVALVPDDPDGLLLVPGGEPAERMHLTLAYLGSDVTGWSEDRRRRVVELVRAAADGTGPLDAHVSGHLAFNPTGGPHGDRAPCAVYLIGDCPDLAPLHDDVTRALTAALGDDLHPQHTPWIPHVTARYGDEDTTGLYYAGPVRFDRVAVHLAGEITTIPLVSANLEAELRQAFIHGWALSGGPLTERVRAACVAAIRHGREHPHPDVVETTIRIGSLEGTMAAVFDRREKLYEHHIAQVQAAWHAAVAGLDIPAAVSRFMGRIGQAREADTDQDRQDTDAIARAEAQRLVHDVIANPAARTYQDMVTALQRAIVEAQAEGQAGTVGLIAEHAGQSGVDFDLVFHDALDQLERLGESWGEAQGWVSRVVAGNANDGGAALAREVRDGGGYDDYVRAVTDVIDGPDTRAVSTLVDLAMNQAYSRGALALYDREGIRTVDYSTAGGGNVCPTCLEYESKNPWPVDQAPAPGWHPWCRCVLMPANPLEAIPPGIARYVGGS